MYKDKLICMKFDKFSLDDGVICMKFDKFSLNDGVILHRRCIVIQLMIKP